MEPTDKDKLDQLDFLKSSFVNDASKNNGTDKKLPKKVPEYNSLKNEKNSIDSILIIDTETTGLESNKDELIEIGCILFHISSRSVLSQLSFLLPITSNNAEHVNGISPELTQVKQPWKDSLNLFLKLVDSCDLLVAHNVEFDKQWFGKGKIPPLNKKWVCSLEDINWSFKRSLKPRPSVTQLSLAFGVPVWNLHRALSDCYYLSEVFKKCEKLEELLVKATEPRYLYKAIVGYDERSKAKNAGFRWNSPIIGAWTKKLSEEEAKELDFDVKRLN